ncbi:MAG: NAD-dependent epimerase/dehydratase family protein, partial [Thermodesulfovibrio sp.]|nr:NAD-dependent epimerase/dehydratase family protein [Thermodesulfovibrio sp.]
MDRNSKIIIFGASGLVGSAIIRKLLEKDYKKIIGIYKSKKPTFKNIQLFQVDLTNQTETEKFFQYHKPEYVFLAAAKVGGILANNTYKADFIYENMAIALNVINSAYKYGVKKLLNLGSSCIYPKHAPQPMKEEYLLTGALEPTNEPYAIAKISAIKLCRYYNEQYGTNFI